MPSFTWSGATGPFNAARFWTPRGVPGAGDTAVVGAGEVTLRLQQVGATVELGGQEEATQPALVLRNATLAALTMPNALPAAPYTTMDSPAEYGTLDVRGYSEVGSVSLGAFANLDKAPPPYGHGPLFAHDNLQVNLLRRAVLDAEFDVKEGSTLTVSGGAGSSLYSDSLVIEGGTVVVDAPFAAGAVTMTRGVIADGFADAGTLELGGPVDAGVSIDIDVGKLLIDTPLAFEGTLNIRNPEGDGASGPSYVGVQDVLLRGLAASSYAFDDETHRMTLFDGNAVLDTVQFSDATTSRSFAMGPNASVDVIQTPDGVQFRGVLDSSPPGSTEIPLHAAMG